MQQFSLSTDIIKASRNDIQQSQPTNSGDNTSLWFFTGTTPKSAGKGLASTGFDDPFIRQKVTILLSVGEMGALLLESLECDVLQEACSFFLNHEDGHLVGIVHQWSSKCTKSSNAILYEVIWEYSSHSPSEVATKFLHEEIEVYKSLTLHLMELESSRGRNAGTRGPEQRWCSMWTQGLEQKQHAMQESPTRLIHPASRNSMLMKLWSQD